MVDLFERKGATSSNIGPIRWMAPESLAADREYSEKSDCFSFGITVSEIISGELPHAELDLLAAAEAIRKGATPSLEKGYPDWLAALLKRCWAMNPKDRPSLAQVLDAIAENLPAADSDDSESEE